MQTTLLFILRFRQESTVLLGPVVGPSRTGEPEQAGPDGRSSGRTWSRPHLEAAVLFGLLGPTLPDRHPPSVLFHAGGVTPPLAFRSGKAFADAKTSRKPRGGVTPPASKKSVDRGAPARQGAGSYPAPTSAFASISQDAHHRAGGLLLGEQTRVVLVVALVAVDDDVLRGGDQTVLNAAETT